MNVHQIPGSHTTTQRETIIEIYSSRTGVGLIGKAKGVNGLNISSGITIVEYNTHFKTMNPIYLFPVCCEIAFFPNIIHVTKIITPLSMQCIVSNAFSYFIKVKYNHTITTWLSQFRFV